MASYGILGRIPQTPELYSYILELYGEVVRDYTKRVLRFESDRIKGFLGIITGFVQTFGGNVSYGIPLKFIEYALLWTQSKNGQNLARNTQFLSWTWAGWKGGCDYEFASTIGFGYNGFWSRTELDPLNVLSRQDRESESLEIHTEAPFGREFKLTENANLAKRFSSSSYLSLSNSDGNICGFLLDYWPNAEPLVCLDLIKLTCTLHPANNRELLEKYKSCLTWAEDVGRAAAGIVVVMAIKCYQDQMERLGISIMFSNMWTKQRPKNEFIKLT